jgi:hypothetical protein
MLEESEYFRLHRQGKVKVLPQMDEPAEHKETPPSAPVPASMPAEMTRIMTLMQEQHKQCMAMMGKEPAAPVVNVTVKEPKEKPEAKKRWEFAVQRDSRGLIETVTAREV